MSNVFLSRKRRSFVPLMDDPIELHEKDGVQQSPRTATVERRVSRASQNEISLADVPSVDIEIQNVSVLSRISTVKKFGNFLGREKNINLADMEAGPTPRASNNIINNVSAQFSSGSLTAILGSSGSGKTSLSVVILTRAIF
jgi:ABC-type glutathione transport system ATPase component